MIQRHANKFIIGIALAAGIVTTVAVLTGPLRAQGSPETAPADVSDESKAVLQVGTYDPREVFQAHPAQAELMEAIQKAQSQMQKAQAEGDQEKMQQIQQGHEQTQGRIIEKFQQDIADKVSEVAKAANLQVVALEVVYAADDVRTKNLTPQLIEVLSKEDEGKREVRQLPQSP